MGEDGSGTLKVTVNGLERAVSRDLSTRRGFMEEVGFSDREWDLFRIDRGEEVQITGEMFVFDSGDEFVIVPSYVGEG